MIDSYVPSTFWVEAVQTSVYLINRQPSSVLGNETPYVRLHHRSPSYLALHPFGCVCFVLLPPHERHKLSSQSARCVFVGYATGQKVFLCYDPLCKKLRVSRNVVFWENIYHFAHTPPPLPSPSLSILPAFTDEPLVRFRPCLVYARHPKPPEPPPSSPPAASAPPTGSQPPRCSTRASRPPSRFGWLAPSFLSSNSIALVPRSYNQAINHDCWKKAMQEELDALAENHT